MASGAKSSEKDQTAQVPPTRQTGPGSATGAALGVQEKEIPSGEDAGSKVEIEGGDIRPDSESPKPIGAQAEPARFTSNGQLPHNHVPSPSGSVPVGATSLSVEDARQRVEDVNQAHDDYVNRRASRQRLSAETVHRLHTSELQAIATQRDYNISFDGGNRTARQQFMEAQDKDAELKGREHAAAKRSAKKAAKRGGRKTKGR